MDALRRARRLTASSTDPAVRSYAYQAAGIVLRDAGRWSEAVPELRAALSSASAANQPDRVADVRATLGATLVVGGRTRAGLRELDSAVDMANGIVLARIVMRRAYVLSALGRHAEALKDLSRALAGCRAHHDVLWEARTLTNRALVHVARGSLGRADADLTDAESLFRRVGQDLEAVMLVHNRGLVAYNRGDIPGTLTLYDRAARGYSELSHVEPELAYHRCQALLAAGLAAEAGQVVDEALQAAALPTRQAELHFISASVALVDGDPGLALRRARVASRLFRQQRRSWWQARADLVVLQARQIRGDGGDRLIGQAAELADRLVDLKADDAPLALLLAGRLATKRHPDEAHRLLTAAARYRRRPAPLVRATGWLGQALDRELAGDSRGILSACGRGLDALDEHRQTLGSSELRALATRHGTDLADLALREAVRRGGARRLLTWTERWRATALAEPPVRPSGRDASRLAALRSQARRLEEAQGEGDPQAVARARQAWEQAVRHQRHLLAGTRRQSVRFDVDAFVDAVGERTFVELVEVDGVLHALTVCGGRVRHSVGGPVEAAAQAVAQARFALRQAARGRPATIAAAAERLQQTLLAGVRLGDGPVVVAPPSRLHAVPWTLLPGLADRPVSVVPSATMWLRARAARRPSGERTVLVAGPGLGTGGAEVDVLAPGATTVLRDGTATVEATLAALDGSRLAHVAAHGDFRPDSPMFSSLRLDDGPLTVHDLELLRRPPHRLVLSACDSGVMAPVGADELLGLTAALLSLGTAGVVASVAEVNDEATVQLMLDLHAALAAGSGLAEAMHHARRAGAGDAVSQATAAAFVALGV
ncbi:CHAT domain-containing protein [Nocardioides mangrovicus]|uniref:CHAT domain-containing protein n=1 Tax=Nocardioides mangrovicus TaxID=2478913 RepID=A0A3L8P5F7_9ACTN|nr:CHAT domain-containing protein [Nocardioides mangrovicus]